jgi:hypothetical protein
MAVPFSTRSRRKSKYPPGYRQTPEYWAFRSAKQRCTDPALRQYKDYGGRGIQFRFADFNEFFAELGPRSEGMELDRINNDGHYERGNVRWTTRSQQMRNKRQKQICKHGHPLSGENLGFSRGRITIARRCLTCHREAETLRRKRVPKTPYKRRQRNPEYWPKYYSRNRERLIARKRELRRLAKLKENKS